MEDDDKFRSYSSPITNGRITVTVASPAPPPPHDSLTLALPIQHQQRTPVSGGSGGGREDCWSEEATAVLIDAWGERYLQLSRGNLKQKHWKEVADVVSSREDYGKTPKTDIQCKNRIDTVKKKYKTEKARIAAGGGPSKWRFYDKMDELIGSSAKISSATVTPQLDGNSMYRSLPMGIPVGVRSGGAVPQQQLQQRPNLRVGKGVQPDSDEESEPENSAESSDGLPPESYKRPRIKKETVGMSYAGPMRHGGMNRKSGGASGIGNKESNSRDSMGELTEAILKFGEAYEQAETAKLQQLIDMEKQRMKFTKELELQRMQFFMKMQMELSQLKRRRPGNNSNHRVINNNNGVNNNNNSDSSN